MRAPPPLERPVMLEPDRTPDSGFRLAPSGTRTPHGEFRSTKRRPPSGAGLQMQENQQVRACGGMHNVANKPPASTSACPGFDVG